MVTKKMMKLRHTPVPCLRLRLSLLLRPAWLSFLAFYSALLNGRPTLELDGLDLR